MLNINAIHVIEVAFKVNGSHIRHTTLRVKHGSIQAVRDEALMAIADLWNVDFKTVEIVSIN